MSAIKKLYDEFQRQWSEMNIAANRDLRAANILEEYGLDASDDQVADDLAKSNCLDDYSGEPVLTECDRQRSKIFKFQKEHGVDQVAHLLEEHSSNDDDADQAVNSECRRPSGRLIPPNRLKTLLRKFKVWYVGDATESHPLVRAALKGADDIDRPAVQRFAEAYRLLLQALDATGPPALTGRSAIDQVDSETLFEWEGARWWVANICAADAPERETMTESELLERLDPNLSDAEKNIVDTLQRAGVRKNQREILDALGPNVSVGTTKNSLAAMVRHKILNRGKDDRGDGYGLPSWHEVYT